MKNLSYRLLIFLFFMSIFIWAQEDSFEYHISELPQKAWEISKDQLAVKAKKDYLKAQIEKEKISQKLAIEIEKLQKLQEDYQQNNKLVTKVQIQSKQIKIETLKNWIKVLTIRMQWSENKIFLLQKDPWSFIASKNTTNNPLYATHEKLFHIFLPKDLPLTDNEKELAEKIKKKIWDFIISNDKARLGLSAFLLVPGLNENDVLESAENYYNLLRSNISFVRKLAKEFRFLYLLFIYDSELGKSISNYKEQARPIEHPELEPYIEDFKNNIAKNFAQQITYNENTKEVVPKEGTFDYVIVGSGPAGAVLAHELRQNGKKVILVERGSFVIPGTVDPVRISAFKEKNNLRMSEDGAIIIRNGNIVGGGSTVNIDLAFSPNLATIQSRIESWRKLGYIKQDQFTKEEIATAYAWVEKSIKTRKLKESEINNNNQILWQGSKKLGWEPSLYDLNRSEYGQSYTITDKISAVEAFILKALLDKDNPLHLLENTEVTKILYKSTNNINNAYAVEVKKLPSWYDKGTLSDLHNLAIPEGETFTIKAKKIVLAAGSLGSATILLKSGVDKINNNVGKGIVIHPSIPIIGIFNHKINIMQGLTASVYNDHFALQQGNGFIFESMSAGPEYAALMLQGNGLEIYNLVRQYSNLGGFGVMLVDEPSPENRVILDNEGFPQIVYQVTESDKQRFCEGVKKAAQIIFAANAKKVTLPTAENLFYPQQPKLYFDNISEAESALEKLQFIPNQTVLTSAHMQGSNKMGQDPKNSVVDTNGKVWGFDNLYISDSSIFPTSVGANPMQSIYTFAKILADKWNNLE